MAYMTPARAGARHLKDCAGCTACDGLRGLGADSKEAAKEAAKAAAEEKARVAAEAARQKAAAAAFDREAAARGFVAQKNSDAAMTNVKLVAGFAALAGLLIFVVRR